MMIFVISKENAVVFFFNLKSYECWYSPFFFFLKYWAVSSIY